MNYLLHILIMIGIYIILSLSLNLLVGYGGLLSIAHAAFYGIGAYIYTLILINWGLPFWLALVISILGTGLIALVVAYPALRLKGDYFILATIGLQMIVFDILYNWVNLTRGPYGIPGIPRASLFGFEFRSIPANLLLVAVLTVLVVLFSKGIFNSPFGRILKSIREDETASKAMGKNTTKVKIWAFVLAGGIAAIAEALYASYITYIDPTSFTLDESIFILAVILVGGSGNLKGPIVGAAFMIILPELLRFLGLPDTIAPNVRQIIYALTLILLMFFRPQGIAGEYKLK